MKRQLRKFVVPIVFLVPFLVGADEWERLDGEQGYTTGREQVLRQDEPQGRTGILRVGAEFLSVPYRWSGDDPVQGFDSSGFVYEVLRLNGYDFPRGIDRQLAAVEQIGKAALKPGYLVFFADSLGRPAQVGLYTGRGRFLHASPRAGQVVLSPLHGEFFQRRFLAAGKLPGWDENEIVPEGFFDTLSTEGAMVTYTTTVEGPPVQSWDPEEEKLVKPLFRRPDWYHSTDVDAERAVFEPVVAELEAEEEVARGWRLRVGEIVSTGRSFLPSL